MGSQLAVSAGASHVEWMAVSLGQVSANRFPAGLALPPHSHPEATIAVVLAGGFRGSYRDGERDCAARSVIVEPAGERHANRFGNGSSTVVTVSLDPERIGSTVEAATHRFSHGRDPYAELIARRVAVELDRPDDVTPLAVEAAALDLISRITRTSTPERRAPWLGAARAFLHDRYAETLTLGDVATAVGVEPDRVARAFRRAFGEPIAGYLRRIRVDAAAALLTSSDLPISRIAGEVGFADQSHLTRCFGQYLGTTPARYRADRSRRHR
jgi:AraC-like DNA-binding protein/quercetin dioxygenase-like cupin family protein